MQKNAQDRVQTRSSSRKNQKGKDKRKGGDSDKKADATGGDRGKMEVQQAFDNLDQRQQQILQGAAEELITQKFLPQVQQQQQQQAGRQQVFLPPQQQQQLQSSQAQQQQRAGQQVFLPPPQQQQTQSTQVQQQQQAGRQQVFLPPQQQSQSPQVQQQQQPGRQQVFLPPQQQSQSPQVQQQQLPGRQQLFLPPQQQPQPSQVQQDHQFLQPRPPPPYPHPRQHQQQVPTASPGRPQQQIPSSTIQGLPPASGRQSQQQENRMRGQHPEAWLEGVNLANLVLQGGDTVQPEVGAVEEVESSEHAEDMDVDESSSDTNDLIALESPSFLQNLGAAGGGPEFPTTQEGGDVSMQSLTGEDIWNIIDGPDNSILTSFLSSHSSDDQQKISLGTILDVLGINQEPGAEEQSPTPGPAPSSPSQAYANPNPHQAAGGQQLAVADAAEMGKFSRVMWSPPDQIRDYVQQQESLVHSQHGGGTQAPPSAPGPSGTSPVHQPPATATSPSIPPPAPSTTILPYPAAASIPVPQAISAIEHQQAVQHVQGISGPVAACVTNAGATAGTSSQAMSTCAGEELGSGSIPSPKLPEYHELVVRGYYRQQELFKIGVQTEGGCLLYYSKPAKRPDEDLSNVTPVPFHELKDQSKSADYTKKVLDVMTKGVLIQERDGCLFATRRCRSKVFVCSSQDIKGDSKELQRDEETLVFNPYLFEKRYRKWLLKGDEKKASKPRPPNIVFTFAQRWSWNSHHPLMNCLVYAVVTPMRARTQLAWGPGNSEAVDSLNRDYSAGMLQVSSESSRTSSSGHSSGGMTS